MDAGSEVEMEEDAETWRDSQREKQPEIDAERRKEASSSGAGEKESKDPASIQRQGDCVRGVLGREKGRERSSGG